MIETLQHVVSLQSTTDLNEIDGEDAHADDSL